VAEGHIVTLSISGGDADMIMSFKFLVLMLQYTYFNGIVDPKMRFTVPHVVPNYLFFLCNTSWDLLLCSMQKKESYINTRVNDDIISLFGELSL